MNHLFCKEAKYLKFSKFYPIERKFKASFKYTAVVGVGGNLGDVSKRFRNLYHFWLKDRRVKVIETSPILINSAFGYTKQDDFYNAMMLIQTSLDAKKFLLFLQHSEKVFKRERSFKNAPRTLDLDIIFFENKKQKRKGLIIPHPKWQERVSVVVPLGLLKNF